MRKIQNGRLSVLIFESKKERFPLVVRIIPLWHVAVRRHTSPQAASITLQHPSPLLSSLALPRNCRLVTSVSQRTKTPYIRVLLPRQSACYLTILKKETSFRHLLTCLLSVRFLFLASTYFAPENGRCHISRPTSSRGTATGCGSNGYGFQVQQTSRA
jgi:hypothetical protein